MLKNQWVEVVESSLWKNTTLVILSSSGGNYTLVEEIETEDWL